MPRVSWCLAHRRLILKEFKYSNMSIILFSGASMIMITTKTQLCKTTWTMCALLLRSRSDPPRSRTNAALECPCKTPSTCLPQWKREPTEKKTRMATKLLCSCLIPRDRHTTIDIVLRWCYLHYQLPSSACAVTYSFGTDLWVSLFVHHRDACYNDLQHIVNFHFSLC